MQTRNVFLVFTILIFLSKGIAQNITQTVTGIVMDQESSVTLVGVSVALLDGEMEIGTVTDEEGRFELKGVPVGRRQFQFSYIGYQTQVTEGIIITSQRPEYLEIRLQEGVTLENVQIVADGNANAPINDLATVSARSFSVEETERIAASINDMGRMALSFPGVQQGGDDTENDIIIRGNSSVGVLWRLEGIDIPNPNHFARPGTSGGGITIFSAQLLSKSDFYTGGMPAEFGNALSGAFDVRFRKGNYLDRSHRIRIGLLGLDFATEGPIQEGKSSYLVNYRYSTLGLLNKMGFYVIGERVSNDFQDLSFNLAFDGKQKGVKWTVFGIGGLSVEHYEPVAVPEEREIGIANHWEDRYQGSNMGALGVTYTKIIDETSYIKGTTALMSGYVFRKFDTLSLQDIPYRYNTQDYLDSRISTAWTYRKEFSSMVNIKLGTIMHGINYDFYKGTKARSSTEDITLQNEAVNLNGGGNAFQGQLYGLVQYSPTSRLDINAGLHGLYLGINNTTALDPRLSMKYVVSRGQQLGLAIGKHSQTLPFAAYFYEERDLLSSDSRAVIRPNFNSPFMSANHYIASYTFVTRGLLKFNAEVYYQTLNKIPVLEEDEGGYWMLNNQADFPQQNTVSNGKGENYGIDLALEKFFSNKIYFLATASFFESNYILNDGSKYPTRFSTKWVSTWTLGKEFEFRNGKALQIGARAMYNGGFRYTPYDPVASAAAGTYVPLNNAWWTGQVSPYWRVDSRISYRYNGKRMSGSINLDIQNLTGHKNENRAAYNAATNELTFRNYPGGDFIPVLSFVFDF